MSPPHERKAQPQKEKLCALTRASERTDVRLTAHVTLTRKRTRGTPNGS